MKFYLNIIGLMLFVSTLSSCAALKASKCERCPEFTEVQQNTTTAQIDCMFE